jgi:hypothetical protein
MYVYAAHAPFERIVMFCFCCCLIFLIALQINKHDRNARRIRAYTVRASTKSMDGYVLAQTGIRAFRARYVSFVVCALAIRAALMPLRFISTVIGRYQ